ncbi:hypothetical protein Gotri_007578 [Gossypium trilobum]|uniref:Uncharacterized protein n=1 Tax=Gossypium trilobum TaxID=34281 RepID=A0A7J9EGL2_9ROSI|nr:hypothetical protein [Gossypium trilobum]
MSSCKNKLLFKELQNFNAYLLQLHLDLSHVLVDDCDVVGVAMAFLFLLDGGNDHLGGTMGADDILVGEKEKVAFLDGDFFKGEDNGDNIPHEHDHLLIALVAWKVISQQLILDCERLKGCLIFSSVGWVPTSENDAKPFFICNTPNPT